MIHINTKVALSGEYRLVINRGGLEIDTGWFKNVILNQGLDQLGTAGANVLLGYARVGTGTSTPNATNTTLEAQVAVSESGPANTTVLNSGAASYTTLTTYQYTFTQGSVTGNISEVGVGWATTGATLFSRARIVDGSGTPTTITLTSIDQLTIYYRLNASQPLTDTTSSVTISSTSYPYTIRTAQAASFCYSTATFYYADAFTKLNSTSGVTVYGNDATLGAITGTLSGTIIGSAGAGGFSFTYPAYTPGTYYRDSTFSIAPGYANDVGGIGGMTLQWGQYGSSLQNQIVFSTPIPKTNTQVLTLTQRFSWSAP
jgi:hypothetical protein